MPKVPRGHVLVGEVVGVFGIRGALKVEPQTDFPERFSPGASLFLNGLSRKIVSTAWHKTQARVKFEGIESPEAALTYVGAAVTLPEEERPKLDRDTFLTRELIGCRLIDQASGEELGVINAVERSPLYDILVSGDAMVPAIKQFVKSVDLESKRVVITPLAGMFEPPTEEDTP
jgi:16S rRNA processing protein RimM